MQYILECRVNAKERIIRVSEQQGKELQRLQLDGRLPPVISLNGETLLAVSIQLISPEGAWFEHDRKALASKGHQRCKDCLTVKPFGETCCVRRVNPLKDEPDYLRDAESLSPDRMRAGWIRALKAARTASPNNWRKFGDSIMERYLIAPEEVTV